MTALLNPIGIGTVPFDHTGDEARSGFTKILTAHQAFIAAAGRRATQPGTYGITTSGGSSQTVLNDATQNWTPNQFFGLTLTIQSGAPPILINGILTAQSNNGYSRAVLSNTATSITAASPFPFNIDNGATYEVSPGIVNVGSDGFATSAGATGPNTLIDTKQGWTANQWQGFAVTLFGGAFAGLSFPIASNTVSALTLVGSGALTGPIAAGTPYVIGPLTLAMNDFTHTISATPGNAQNDYNAGGLFVPGVDCVLLNAPGGNALFTGWNATGVPDRWRVLLIETSLNNQLWFTDKSGLSLPANIFQTSGNGGQIIDKGAMGIIMNIAGVGWMFS